MKERNQIKIMLSNNNALFAQTRNVRIKSVKIEDSECNGKV